MLKGLIIILIVFVSINYSQNMSKINSISEPVVTKNNLDWLIGSWVRQNNKKGRKTFEHWEKKSENEYSGHGYTVQKNIRIFNEEMRIIKVNGILSLVVTGVNEQPTIFQFIKQTENSFICKNDKNKFPKKIEYSMDGDMLIAKISDRSTEILFLFKKLLAK